MTASTQTFFAKGPKTRKNSFLSMFKLRSCTGSKRNTVPEISLEISSPVNLCPALEHKASTIMKEENARAKMAGRKPRAAVKSWRGPFQREEELDHYARYDRIRSRRLDAEDMEDCWW